MRTLGVDLAASPANTGVCIVDWTAGTVTPGPIWKAGDLTASDAWIVETVLGCDRSGFDVPLGWPDGFVAAVAAHHGDGPWPGAEDQSALRLRVTDQMPELDELKLHPLSVSTDRIGVPAMRAARLQDQLRRRGRPVDRSGVDGPVAETYPAGALAAWGLPSRGYKGARNRETCAALVAAVADACGPLAASARDALDGCDDHLLDAFLCAVLARASVQGQTTVPSPEHQAVAAREGWIHLPRRGVTLAQVVAGP